MKKGFTLIELITVIAIIAILAGIVSPNAFKAIDKAKRSATISDWQAIKTSIIAFEADTGVWPADGCEEAVLANTGVDCNRATTADNYYGWSGPYLEQWPSGNRWGGNYVLVNDNCIDWEVADDSGATCGAAGVPDSIFIVLDRIPLEVRRTLDEQIDGPPLAGTCAGGINAGRNCGQYRWGTAQNSDSYLLTVTDQIILK